MPPIDPYRVLQVAPTAEQEVITAAFRALAIKYHPDREQGRYAAKRMAELNTAYALVRDQSAREAWDRNRRRESATSGTIIVPPAGAAPDTSSPGTRLDFGRYAGWRLADVARHDKQYLVWLARHASGKSYREEVGELLAKKGIAVA